MYASERIIGEPHIGVWRREVAEIAQASSVGGGSEYFLPDNERCEIHS